MEIFRGQKTASVLLATESVTVGSRVHHVQNRTIILLNCDWINKSFLLIVLLTYLSMSCLLRVSSSRVSFFFKKKVENLFFMYHLQYGM